MVKVEITNIAFLGEGTGPNGPARNWQVKFAINGSGVSTIIEIPVEGPRDDISGRQAEINALARLREFLRGACAAADEIQID